MRARTILAALLVAAAPASAAADVERLTFAGAIQETLARSGDVAAAHATEAAARSRVAGARARRLPSLTVAAVADLYTEPYQLDFGGAKVTLHDQVTSVATVRIEQPLVGLAYLSELVGAAAHDAGAAYADYERARLDAAYGTADAYLRLLEARAAAEVAAQALADVTAVLERTRALRAADSVTDVDVLRVQSAQAAAAQAQVRADAARAIAEAQLAAAIGLPDGTAIEAGDDLPAAPPPLALTVDQAIARAIAARPELRAAQERVAAAGDLVSSKRAGYLPSLNAVGVYQHTTGVEPFQPENEEYVGLQLSWKLWDWGATRRDVEEAEHLRTRARLTAGTLADRVRLEVRRRWLDARAGHDSLGAVETQVASAEEAYRLQQVKFANAVATTTDVLDAETEVARARLAAALARYDYYLGLVALARAVGDVPSL